MIPIIYLVHKTVDMPFLNRHSRAQILANPELKRVDYENAKASKDFLEIPQQHLASLKELDLLPKAFSQGPPTLIIKAKSGSSGYCFIRNASSKYFD